MSTTTVKTVTNGNVQTITTTTYTPGVNGGPGSTKVSTRTITTSTKPGPPQPVPQQPQQVPAQQQPPQQQPRPTVTPAPAPAPAPAAPTRPHEPPSVPAQSAPPKKTGFFSSLRNHVLPQNDTPKSRPSSLLPPPQSQPTTTRTTVVRTETDDGPLDQLAEKMKNAALNRPSLPTPTSTTSTTSTRVVHTSSNNSGYPDDAISRLKRSMPMFTQAFRGNRLDVESVNFDKEDAHARACPKSDASSVAKLSKYLTSPFKSNQVSQLRTIYTWIADNIAYDVRGYLSGRYGDQTPEGVLKTRTGVCEGYSNLFLALSDEAGLTGVRKVIGVARGVDTQVGDSRLGGPHAWIAVNVEGEYLMIDATWGAGVCDLASQSFTKKFRSFFFLIRPNRLIYTHWPEDPKEQFLDPPVEEKIFRGLPAIKPESWNLGLKIAGSQRGNTIEAKDDFVQVEIKLKKRAKDGLTGKLMGQVAWKGYSKAVPTLCQYVKEDEKHVWMAIKFWCPSAGTGELKVFGWPPGGDQTKAGPQCLSFKVVNETGTGKNAKQLIQTYVVKGFSFSVLDPITAQVKKGTNQVIRVRVFDVEAGAKPMLALQAPEGGMPEKLQQVEKDLFEIQKTVTGGQWKIVQMTSEYGFAFAAVFEAV